MHSFDRFQSCCICGKPTDEFQLTKAGRVCIGCLEELEGAYRVFDSLEPGTYAIRFDHGGETNYRFYWHSTGKSELVGVANQQPGSEGFEAFLNGNDFTFADEEELKDALPGLVILDANGLLEYARIVSGNASVPIKYELWT